MSGLRLGVNIDHVATLRNARGGAYPCPVAAAQVAKLAGADGITAHLREDRRHIRDADIERLKREVALPLNLEMAATAEMQKIALSVLPHAVCLVPEKRLELTTEGGLDVAGHTQRMTDFIAPLKSAGIRISLFIDAKHTQVEAAARVGADIVELHTGTYAEHWPAVDMYLQGISRAAELAHNLGLEVHAGHGLTDENVRPIAEIPQMRELNIGHYLIAKSVFTGLPEAVSHMKKLMREARA